MCYQYIGCIGGHVTLSLRHWELTSLLRHIRCELLIKRMSTYGNVTREKRGTLKSNAGDQKVCKKKNLSWLFAADRKIRLSKSLFGITRHRHVSNESETFLRPFDDKSKIRRKETSFSCNFLRDSNNLKLQKVCIKAFWKTFGYVAAITSVL